MPLRRKLPIEEIENLGYDNFIGYLEVPFFNIGGVSSIDQLAKLFKRNENTRACVIVHSWQSVS